MNSITQSQTIKVMSYNIRYDNRWDKANNWDKRKGGIVDLIKKYKPVIIGAQEGLHNQINFLDKSLKNFTYTGTGREDGQKKGEYCAIFYDTTSFSLIKSSTFWLSESPGKVSTGWDAALERICTYGLFKNNADSSDVWIFNTHFDHKGKLARKKSAKLIVEKIKSLSGDFKNPVILMGDINALPGDEPVSHIVDYMNDSRDISEHKPEGPAGTFNGFDRGSPLEKRIDYIFVKSVKVKNHLTIDDQYNGNYPSDHLPVMVEIFQ